MGIIGDLVVILFVTALIRGLGVGVLNASPQLRSRLVVSSANPEVVKQSETGVHIALTVAALVLALLIVFAGKFVATVLLAALVLAVLFGVARKVSNRVATFTESTLGTVTRLQTKSE